MGMEAEIEDLRLVLNIAESEDLDEELPIIIDRELKSIKIYLDDHAWQAVENLIVKKYENLKSEDIAETEKSFSKE